MGIKQAAIKELESLMEEFDIAPTRLGRDLFGDPGFIKRLNKEKTRVTDKTLDTIFRFAVEKRGQLNLDLDLEMENGEE